MVGVRCLALKAHKGNGYCWENTRKTTLYFRYENQYLQRFQRILNGNFIHNFQSRCVLLLVNFLLLSSPALSRFSSREMNNLFFYA